jgi:hypothetical protein
MNFSLDLGTLLNGTILAAVSAGIYGIVAIIKAVAKLQTWADEHAKLDDERHATIMVHLSERKIR